MSSSERGTGPGADKSSIPSLKMVLFDHRQNLIAYVTKQMPPKLSASFDAADIVQDVYFEALRRETQFIELDPQARTRWLMTIARNRILYLLRRHTASKRANQPGDEGDSLVVLLEELAKYGRTPSASAASHETHFAVRQSVERLSPAHSEAIRWRFFEGRSHSEVAQLTGKTENAVRQLCHYALGALRKDLASAFSFG